MDTESLPEHYVRTESSVAILVGLAAIVVAVLLFSDCGSTRIAGSIVTMYSVCVALHSISTVQVDERSVSVRVGCGLFQRKVPIEQIVSCEIRKEPWWRLRLMLLCCMVKVGGTHAVTLRLKSGRAFKVRSNDTVALARAIQLHLPVR